MSDPYEDYMHDTRYNDGEYYGVEEDGDDQQDCGDEEGGSRKKAKRSKSRSDRGKRIRDVVDKGGEYDGPCYYHRGNTDQCISITEREVRFNNFKAECKKNNA